MVRRQYDTYDHILDGQVHQIVPVPTGVTPLIAALERVLSEAEAAVRMCAALLHGPLQGYTLHQKVLPSEERL